MKRVYKYFIDFLDKQEQWLNDMAKKGYRLKKCGIASYTFESCKPEEYEYAVEYVGEKSSAKANDYRAFLESLGFRTLTKNINLNYSIGKLKWRPYAKGKGQIAASPGSYNKELLILEKKKDDQPFEIHTSIQDKLAFYRKIRNVYTYVCLLLLTFGGISLLENWLKGMILLPIGVMFMIPAIKYWSKVRQLKERSKISQ